MCWIGVRALPTTLICLLAAGLTVDTGIPVQCPCILYNVRVRVSDTHNTIPDVHVLLQIQCVGGS